MLKNLFLAVVLLAFVPGIAQTTTDKVEKDYHEPGAEMPAFKLVTFDSVDYKLSKKERIEMKKNHQPDVKFVKRGKILTERDFDNKGNLIVMMFNPLCGHCEDQTDMIARNATVFTEGGKDTRVILMANTNMVTYLPDFIKNHKVNQYPVFKIGMDSSGFIKETFLYSALPQINIYDKNRKLLKIYTGGVRMDSLLQYVE